MASSVPWPLRLLLFVLAVGGSGAAFAGSKKLIQPPPSPYRLQLPNPGTPEPYRLNPAYRAPANLPSQVPFAREVAMAAEAANLDPALVHAVIHVESRHQAKAVSPKGAVGLMQVLPETAARFGVSKPDQSVEANLRAGTLYLRSLMRQFDGRTDLVLAAYNAGEGAVVDHNYSIPPYAETRSYVPAVLKKYDEWRAPGTARGQREYLPGTRLLPIR
ncbi:MAG: lytic transglycosylase domain-containing protein [Rhodocyclaceae bacterium]|nr:lytic transglycosylase domain-containing protein [Rhodocyclaceae bacterium]